MGTGRTKTAGFKAVVKGACAPFGSSDGNEMPAACKAYFLSIWPDMNVLNNFDTASDAYCAGVTYTDDEGNTQNYSADGSDQELVVDNQAGKNRCACLNFIDFSMANMDLA